MSPLPLTELGENGTLRTILTVFSILIAIFGTLSNSLSLSYFIKIIRSNRQRRNTDAPTTKLFAALNVVDLLVSLTASSAVISNIDFVTLYYVLTETLRASVFITGLLTCLLAVIRTINLVFPLHVINWTAVKVIPVICSVVVVTCEIFHIAGNWSNFAAARKITVAFKIPRIFGFLVQASVFLTVVLTNITSLCTLNFSQSSHTETRNIKRRATITVSIISAIYCVCNIGFMVFFGIYTFSEPNSLITMAVPTEVRYISNYILLSLNSACNPVVYLIRKEDMRSYVKTLWGRVKKGLCERGRDDRI